MEKPVTPPNILADDVSFRAYVRRTDPGAVQYWTDWLARHPDRAADVAEATRFVQHLDAFRPRQLSKQAVEQEINRLAQRLDRERIGSEANVTATDIAPTQPMRWWRNNTFRRVAAASVVTLLTTFGVHWYADRENQFVSHGPPLVSAPTPESVTAQPNAQKSAPERFTQTEYGQRRTVQLPDGSVVTLNAHSTLVLSPDWANGRREVILNGEAFFRVSKQRRSGRPVKFRVLANNVAVEVLGTQFNVSTRNERVKVVLNEGRIRLNVLTDAGNTTARTLDMLPGDLVEVSERQQVVLNSRVLVAEHSAWVMGELVFDDTPLHEVADVIEENYGYTVEFADPALATQRLTATLPDPNLDVLLKALEKAFSLSITKHSNIIRLARNQ